MAETKTTKTREEAIQETLDTIRQRYYSDIDSINSKIDYAINDGMFSVFIDYVPNNDVQIYFRDGFGYTIEPSIQKPTEREIKQDIQGIQISWYKKSKIEPIEIKAVR